MLKEFESHICYVKKKLKTEVEGALIKVQCFHDTANIMFIYRFCYLSGVFYDNLIKDVQSCTRPNSLDLLFTMIN